MGNINPTAAALEPTPSARSGVAYNRFNSAEKQRAFAAYLKNHYQHGVGRERPEEVSQSLSKLVQNYQPTTIFDPQKYEQHEQHYRLNNYDNKNRIINNDTKYRIFN